MQCYSSVKRKEKLFIYKLACINFKILMLSKRSQVKKKKKSTYILYDFIYKYKILKNANESIVTENVSVVAGDYFLTYPF